MRYYLFTVQYNKEKKAENRPIPKAFDTLEGAVAQFHTQVGNDMTNTALGWSLNMVIDELGNVMRSERWTAEAEETAE